MIPALFILLAFPTAAFLGSGVWLLRRVARLEAAAGRLQETVAALGNDKVRRGEAAQAVRGLQDTLRTVRDELSQRTRRIDEHSVWLGEAHEPWLMRHERRLAVLEEKTEFDLRAVEAQLRINARLTTPEEAASTACPVCGRPSFNSIAAYVDPFIAERCAVPADTQARSHLCGNCEHVFFTPFLSADMLARLYTGYRDKTYTAQRVMRDPEYAKHAQAFDDAGAPYYAARQKFYDEFLPKFRNFKGLVVDYGGGDGRFSRYVFPQAEIVIVEESYERDGGDLDGLLARTDVLFCAQVFEHIPRPHDLFDRLAQRLPDHARVWVEIPIDYKGELSERFLELQRSGDPTYRSSLQLLHEHVGHFSPKSLTALLARSGFETDLVAVAEFAAAVLGHRARPIAAATAEPQADVAEQDREPDYDKAAFRRDLPVVFDSGDARVVFQAGEEQEFWITFGARGAREACCTNIIRARRATAYHIYSLTDDWYRSEDAHAAVAFIAERLAHRQGRLVVFGASMGGYGALLHADALKPDLMMLGYPQVVVDDARSVGVDDRWRADWRRLKADGTLAVDILPRRPDALSFIVYDPFDPFDRWHLKHLEGEGSVHEVRLPFTGHEVYLELAQAKFSSPLEAAMLSGDPDKVDEVARAFRRSRRERWHYYVWLGQALMRHDRTALASYIYWQVVQKWPEDTFGYIFLSDTLRTLGKPDEALRVLDVGAPYCKNQDERDIFDERFALFRQAA